MISLRLYVITALIAAAVASAAWFHGYHDGWDSGRQNLAQQYKDKATAQLAKASSNIKQGEVKAAQSINGSNQQFTVIEREVIKYRSRPNPDKCVFDDVRVRTKRAALDAAGNIPGLDDSAG